MSNKKIRRGLHGLSVTVTALFCFMALCPCPVWSQAASGPAEPSVVERARGGGLPSPGNVTVNFREVDINTVLHYLSEISGIDIVPAPGVEGSVTMRLRDKPWRTALDIVTRNYGYVYSEEEDIIRIMPRGQLDREETRTEVIPLKNIAREIELVRRSQRMGEEVGIEETDISIQQILDAVNSLLDASRGERATFIQGVNSIVVTAIPTKMNEIKRIIEVIDQRPPQIVLDAKVVEINLRKDERFGVDWNAVMSAAGARRPITFPFTSDGVLGFLPGIQRRFYPDTARQVLDATGTPIADLYRREGDSVFQSVQAVAIPPSTDTSEDMFSFGTLDFSTFSATLRLLDKRGDTEILSSPRITTLNNQRATIKVIDKVMLQESVRATDTGNTVTVQFESEDQAREVGVKLTVVPRVNDKGEITVNLLPEVSSDINFRTIDLDDVGNIQTTVAMSYSSREANTIVRVNDGETIFLGGLINRSVSQTENKFPILGDLFGGIPILGNVFKYEAEDVSRTEIAFFVTVNLVHGAMDTIDFTQMREHYDKYIASGDEDMAEQSPVVVIERGEMKSHEKKEIIKLPASPPAEKKERKPFLDFRR